MKKAVFIAMAALVLLTAQCKKNEPKPEEKVMVPITGTVDFGGGSKTEITTAGYITPVAGDKIYIYNAGTNVGSMTCTAVSGQQFECSGEIEEDCLGITCTFMYLGSNNEVDGESEIISFADQTDVRVVDDKIEGLEKFHVGSCTATVSQEGTVTLSMLSVMSIAYFQLKDGSGNPIADKDIAVSGVSATATINKAEGTLTGSGTGTVTVHADAQGCFYMALIPQSDAVTFSFAGDGKEGQRTFSNGIRPCSFYSAQGLGVPIVVTMEIYNEYVDLNNLELGVTGLPLWAKYNIGVDPTNLDAACDWYGDYYAWGELEPYYTSINWTAFDSGIAAGWCVHPSHNDGIIFDDVKGYKWENYIGFYPETLNAFCEWDPKPYDSDNILKDDYDIVRQHTSWGGSWRMPTIDEWQQLKDNTYWVWVNSYDGVANLKGIIVYKVKSEEDKGAFRTTAPSGQSYELNDLHLFLPAAGNFDGTSLYHAGTGCYYWSSSLCSDIYYAFRIYYDIFAGWNSPSFNEYMRYGGFTVRPVRSSQN